MTEPQPEIAPDDDSLDTEDVEDDETPDDETPDGDEAPPLPTGPQDEV